MVSIAVLDDYQRVAEGMADWSRLQRDHRVVFHHTHLATTDAAVAALAGFDVLAIMRERTPIDAVLLARLPDVRCIVTTGHRNAAIDMTAAAARAITVCGTDAPGSATAELAFAMILGLARNLGAESANMREGRWQTTIGLDLNGATLGLLGLGKLGRHMTKIATVFGMKVIAWSQNLTAETAHAAGAERVEKDELFARADFISIHTRLSERTRGIVGAAELARMKPTAYIVNTSRGPIIDEAALISVLEAGRIAGAALDVYEPEPLPANHKLRSTPRLMLTPHLGYVTHDTYRQFYGGTVAAIEAWIAGKPIHVIAP